MVGRWIQRKLDQALRAIGKALEKVLPKGVW